MAAPRNRWEVDRAYTERVDSLMREGKEIRRPSEVSEAAHAQLMQEWRTETGTEPPDYLRMLGQEEEDFDDA